MKSSPATSSPLSDNIIDSRRLIAGLREALDLNYARVLATASAHWDRHFAGKDPSDACVTVRIGSGKPLAGVLRKPAGFLHGTGRALLG
jgi:hypothetical protein